MSVNHNHNDNDTETESQTQSESSSCYTGSRSHLYGILGCEWLYSIKKTVRLLLNLRERTQKVETFSGNS